MQALILAAGMGSRLRPLTDEVPKCMVKVNGVSFLENALNVLSKFGVSEVIIVVGYKKEVILDAIGEEYAGMKIIYVDNEIYDKTNNIYSLWLARKHVTDNVLLLESDIYFDEELIEEALKEKNKNVVLVNTYHSYMDGTVLDINDDLSIKRLIPKRDQGENFDFSDKYKTVNIYHFTLDFFRNYFTPNLDAYIKTQSHSQYYELILGVLVYLGHPKLYACIIDNVNWYEIDDMNDLEKAEYLFSSPDEKCAIATSLHGGYWRYDFIDFCYLYNLYFPSARIYRELSYALPELINNYPSGLTRIRKLMSRWFHIPYQDIVVDNGASALIRIINRLLVTKMTIPVPGFNEYENTLDREQINYFCLAEDDFELDVERFIRSVKDSGSNAALIVNPNNPTSLYSSKEKVFHILEELRDLDLVIIDESFIHFVEKEQDPSVQGRYGDFDNLIIIKSLSKEYGIPGMRLGYALSSNRSYIDRISREVPIWNINSMAEYFLEIFIKYQKEFDASCRQIIVDRAGFINELSSIPWLKLYDPSANYIFAKIQGAFTSSELRDELFRRHNLLIKDCSNKEGLEEGRYVRIAVRTPDENRVLVEAMKALEVDPGYTAEKV